MTTLSKKIELKKTERNERPKAGQDVKHTSSINTFASLFFVCFSQV